FRKIASRCGVFLSLDDGTRNCVRFDVARVKIEASLCGRIDFAIKLVIQGAAYVVRVVEEGGGLMREEVYVEDQLRRSDVGSSCASGGQGSVRAVLEGLDGAVSDSDVSKGCNLDRSMERQVVNRSTEYNQGLGLDVDNSDRGAGVVMVIPSIEEQVKKTANNRSVGKHASVRGSIPMVNVEWSDNVEVEAGHVSPNNCGPGRVVIVSGSGVQTGPDHVALDSDLEC
ncbi:hypothetical protein A2U01_0032782, partial [Trifolium medium]|nr:hypothetical protein [Trifolium medium]